MKNKAILLALLLAVLLSFCACDNGDSAQESDDEGQEITINAGVDGTDAQTDKAGTDETSIDETNDETSIDETETPESSNVPVETNEPPVTDEPVDDSPSKIGEFSAADMKIEFAGVTLSIGDNFLDFMDEIAKTEGEPRIEEGQACLEGGYDTNYYYGEEFSVYTYAEGGKQIIYDIYVTRVGFTTAKGAVIGKTTRAEIAKLYGEPTTERPVLDEYMTDDSNVSLSFTYADDVLESIDVLDTGVE